MSELNFKNGSMILERILNTPFNEKNIHSVEDAFVTLINNTEDDNLTNLCEMMHKHPKLSKLPIGRLYVLTKISYNYIDSDTKKIMLDSAYKCLENGMTLGNRVINAGKINSSSWFSHSLYVAEVCSNLAKMLGLNEEIARTLGLLHDIGRKYDHRFSHVTKGCELLCNMGWYNEAVACLTHSFVNGGRCSNNEPAIPGFYVDDNGNPKWEENSKLDDVSYFLDDYDYTDYDRILNIADLMATDKGIVSPYDRIQDIATRRTIDPTNRGYFLSDFTNLLIDFMKKTNSIDEDFPYVKATKDTSIEEIIGKFKLISEYFYSLYSDKTNEFKTDITKRPSGPVLVKKTPQIK